MGVYHKKIMAEVTKFPNQGYTWWELVHVCAYPGTYRGQPTTVLPRERVGRTIMELLHANKLRVTVPDTRFPQYRLGLARGDTNNAIVKRAPWPKKAARKKEFKSGMTVEIRVRGALEVMPGAMVWEIANMVECQLCGTVETHLLNLLKKGEAFIKTWQPIGAVPQFVFFPSKKLDADIERRFKELKQSRKPRHAPYWQLIYRKLRDDYLATGELRKFNSEALADEFKLQSWSMLDRLRELQGKGLVELYEEGEKMSLLSSKLAYRSRVYAVRLSPSEMLKQRVARAKKQAVEKKKLRQARKRAPKATMNDIEL